MTIKFQPGQRAGWAQKKGRRKPKGGFPGGTMAPSGVAPNEVRPGFIPGQPPTTSPVRR